MDIAQRAGQQPAQHVVAAAIAATIHIHTRPTPHPTPHREAVGAREAAEAGGQKHKAALVTSRFVRVV